MPQTHLNIFDGSSGLKQNRLKNLFQRIFLATGGAKEHKISSFIALFQQMVPMARTIV